MSYSDIANDIKSRLEAIPGTGVIHAYERQCTDIKKFIDLFTVATVDNKREIRGFEITRRAVNEHKAGAFFRHHMMLARGYRGLVDADQSAIEWQDLLDTICAAFRAVAQVEGHPEYRNGDNPNDSPAQITIIEDRMFGSYLCHYAEINISVTERIVQ